ncbi:hypothetical protein, partial [Kushneria aurantia]
PLFRSILALCPVNDLQFFVLIGQYKESRIRLPGKNRGLAGATKYNGSERYLLTNCCLKYTRQQFKEVREREGTFRVIDEFLTGDETIAYQFAIRC